jgi:hypothetical protein
MGTADRRKDRKAKRARLQAKKWDRLRERQQVVQVEVVQEMKATLLEIVRSGRARVAVSSIPALNLIVAAMWEQHGSLVQAYDMSIPAAMNALCMAVARQSIGAEEWMEFMTTHMEAVDEADDGEVPISLVQWKIGEGPPQDLSLQAPIKPH